MIEKSGGKTIYFHIMIQNSSEIENKTEAEAINMVILKTNLVSREYDEYFVFVVSRLGDIYFCLGIKEHVYDEYEKHLFYLNVLLLPVVEPTFVKVGVTDVQGWFNFIASS